VKGRTLIRAEGGQLLLWWRRRMITNEVVSWSLAAAAAAVGVAMVVETFSALAVAVGRRKAVLPALPATLEIETPI
jgi:hypothetical protein